jgi:hypothetical protein
MTTTMKTLTTLGFAAAALATTLGPSHAITRLLGHGPVIFHQPSPSLPPKLGIIGGINPVIFHQPSPSLPPKLGIIGGINPVIFHQPSPPPPKISCFACNLPGPQGGARPPVPYHGPYGTGYGNGWNHWGYGGYRSYPVYSGGAPLAPLAAAPVAVAPAAALAPAGNCLTKQMLPNGAELLIDICTQQSAIALPQAASAR